MAASFGTSGLRGLVTELSADVVHDYVRGFLSACDVGSAICIGEDLRASSPGISQVVADAVSACGLTPIRCGAIPTPALALAAGKRDCGAIMVTGSHIPADRNGLKFYKRTGEITKADEAAILGALGGIDPGPDAPEERDKAAADQFKRRYTDAFGAALKGWRIGVFSHTAVGRDLLIETLAALGAEVTELGRESEFVAVDTEAVPSGVRDRLRVWAAEKNLHAIASTDGDSDRPLLTDETGEVIKGDVLGQITAEFLAADVVVTPISSNSGVEQKTFAQVIRTRIGSPFVIEQIGTQSTQRVVGYEANGGFLLGFDAQGPIGALSALPTRDSFLPIIATLCSAAPGQLRDRVSKEPAIFTATDRLKDIPSDISRNLVLGLAEDSDTRRSLLRRLDCTEMAIDRTDGLRMVCEGGRCLHLRPSGNAPELRLYAEARAPEVAERLLAAAVTEVAGRLATGSGNHLR